MRRNPHHDDDRPSLFGDDFALDAPASKRNGPQPVSMLSGLESRKPRPRAKSAQRAAKRQWGWWAALVVLLSVLAVAVAWLARSPSAPNVPSKALPDVQRAAAQAAALAASQLTATPAPLAARLETLPAAATANAAPASSAGSPHTDIETSRLRASAAIPVAPASAQTGLRPVAKLDAAAPADRAAQAAQPVQAGQATQTARVAPAGAAVADKTAGSRVGGAQPSAADADVDLLAALMSHPNLAPHASSTNVQRTAAPPVAAAPPASTPVRATPAVRVARNAAAPNAAKPRVDQSIAALVSNCNARTNKQEALACRRRICEGYWGKAQACPRELQGPPGQSSAPVAPATGRNKA